MCGIAGYIGTAPVPEARIPGCLELMARRGPDACGHVAFRAGDNAIVLLHSRLSIIDVDERANQPFAIDDCVLVFNGEIYNHVELREELEHKGVRFRTRSDTEVLLRCYLEYGEACVEKFEGMWSFAIYDAGRGALFLSRDRFAEKPLYYLETPDGLTFGSEVKFVRALSGRNLTVNHRQLTRYLVNGYKSLYKTRDTFFDEIREVPYATNLVIDRQRRSRWKRYWEPAFTPREVSLAEAIEEVRHHLTESVRLRLRADVPLAFCLSGGVDSSAIASIAAKTFNYNVATFSIVDQDERYNEYDNIKATIDDLGCQHTVIHVPREGTCSRLRELIGYHDAPVYSISYLVHSYLSEAIAHAGFRVAVSGTAADELLTGYYDHYNMHLYEMRDRPEYATCLAQWRAHAGRFVRNPHLQDPRVFCRDPEFRGHIYLNRDYFAGFLTDGFDEEFTEERFCDSLLRNRMLNELFHEVIPVILHEDDLNSMKYSVENRSPYLDSRLFACAFAMPVEHLIRDGYNKYLLREAVKGILNEPVRADRRKKGFNAAVSSIVDLTTPEGRACFLDDGPIFDYVRKDKVESILTQDRWPNSDSKFLFNFLNARLFLEMNGS